MKRWTGWFPAVVCLCVVGAVAGAEEVAKQPDPGDPGLVGYWSGQIEVPGRGIGVNVDMARDGDALRAKIDVPDQGIRKVDTTGLAADGKNVTFHIPGVPGDPTFKGVLTEDGSAIAGDYSQGGQSIPFRLERADKPADYDVDLYADYRKPGRSGKGVTGEWLGLLEAGPHRYRMQLSLTSAEGGFAGTLVSVDQRAMSLPVEDLSVEGRTVTFGASRVRATFEGTLNEDGSELAGQWTQGGQGLPLVFRRAE